MQWQNHLMLTPFIFLIKFFMFWYSSIKLLTLSLATWVQTSNLKKYLLLHQNPWWRNFMWLTSSIVVFSKKKKIHECVDNFLCEKDYIRVHIYGFEKMEHCVYSIFVYNGIWFRKIGCWLVRSQQLVDLVLVVFPLYQCGYLTRAFIKRIKNIK